MGFGRIGRNAFRIIQQNHPGIELVAIVDVADPKALEYLLRFDTVHGPYAEPFSVKQDAMYHRGRQIKMITKREPGDVDGKRGRDRDRGDGKYRYAR
jgi:glyceraldehyde 3-phosphate dehydrogenase